MDIYVTAETEVNGKTYKSQIRIDTENISLTKETYGEKLYTLIKTITRAIEAQEG